MDDAGALRWCQWASRAIPAFVHEKQLRKPAEDTLLAASIVDFSGNNIGDKGCHGILSLLFEHPGSEDAGAFAIWFGSSSRLRIAADKLKLHKNLLGRAAAQTLMHFLGRTEHPLNELHLSHNYITREGAVDILKGVAWNPRYPGTLRDSVGRLKYVPLWLRLESNMISDAEGLLVQAERKMQDARRAVAEGHHVAVASDQAICEIRDIATGAEADYLLVLATVVVHAWTLSGAPANWDAQDVLRCVGEVGVADAEFDEGERWEDMHNALPTRAKTIRNDLYKHVSGDRHVDSYKPFFDAHAFAGTEEQEAGPPYVRFGDWRAGNGAVVLLLKAKVAEGNHSMIRAGGAVRVSAASYKDQHRGFLLGTIRPTFLVEEEGDESGLYVRSGFLLLAAAVASFEFTNLAGVPWYKQAFEHAEELLEGGVNLRQLTDSLLDEFHSFDDTTFLLETEKQLNSILRALEQEHSKNGSAFLALGKVSSGPGDTDDQSENTEAGSVRQAPSKDPAVVAQWTDAKALSTFADLGSKEAQNRPQLGGEWHGVWCPLLHPTRGRPGFRSSDPLLLDSEECRELEQRLRRVRPEQQILLLERSATSAPLMVFGLLAHTVSIRQLWWKVQRLAHPSGCPTLESIARHLPERPTGSGRRQCWLHLQPTVESPESCPTLDGQGHGGLAAQITGGTTASPRTATGLGDPEEDEEESLSRAQFLCRMKTLSDRIGHGAYSAPSRNICVPPGANKAA
ncbi:unnamed protein product [Symbiodinium sp. KB8]|nr:unnamed protein product [Symbiodinium sp. KB8]